MSIFGQRREGRKRGDEKKEFLMKKKKAEKRQNKFKIAKKNKIKQTENCFCGAQKLMVGHVVFQCKWRFRKAFPAHFI